MIHDHTPPRRPKRREPIHNSGVILIPLAGDLGMVRLNAADHARLRAQGFSDQWCLHRDRDGRAYVRVANPERRGGVLTVARLILDTPAGRIIRYRNGDRTDLRRVNLWVKERAIPKVR